MKLLVTYLMLCIFLIDIGIAQELTEDFEGENNVSQTFSNNGYNFNLSNWLEIYNSNPFFDGNSNSQFMVSTDRVFPVFGNIGSISISVGKFYLKSLYLYPGDPDKLTGSVTLKFYNNGAQVGSDLTKLFNGNLDDYEYWEIPVSHNTELIDEVNFILGAGITNLRIDDFTFSVVPEMDVQGNSVSIADGDASPDVADHTDFGSANIAGTTVVRTFTIANTGPKNLALTGTPLVSISGANAADFTVTSLPTTPVTALSGTTTFQVTFDPSVVGVKSATVSIANDDSDENPYNFDIQGTGTVSPEIDITGNGSSIANNDATPSVDDHTDFGSTTTVGGTLSRTFTITNSGNGDLTLSGTPKVTIGGADAADFSVTAQPSSPVAADGGTSTFTIQFDPSVAAIRNATVSIANDDTDENPYLFSISGTGVAVSPPTLTSTAVSSITEGTATSGGEVTDNGGAAVSVRGIVWSKTATPTLTSNEAGHTDDGTGNGVFTSALTNLEAGTLYYVRAYATNTAGTSYGNEVSFTTLDLSIAIDQVVKISDTEYSFDCSIDNQIATTVTAKGIVWSTSQTPTLSSNVGIESVGSGGNTSYTLNATNLSIGPGYYTRAYITTANGTFYSEAVHVGVVPTLPEWGIIALMSCFIFSGGWLLYKKL